MPDLELDPAVAKLLEYAKVKKVISFDELSDFLPEHIVNSDKMDGVLALLETNNVEIEEEDLGSDSGAEGKRPEEQEESGPGPSQEKKRLSITTRTAP